ncbi:MAG: class I SAM-dependent methyltransferase [Candidatus Aminicenantes bacterium]|nr:class I SAM-dependent methyltransferase [Candidatus Aminicenantes bacterium]
MNDRERKYFFAVFDRLPRGGPGSNATTRKAFRRMTGLPARPHILDVGCGPGMQSLELARISGGRVTAIDIHQPFLDRLTEEASRAGLSDRIAAVNMDMSKLAFSGRRFDLVWAEGSLYSVGFENALRHLRGVLKRGGWLAASEAVLFKAEVPKDVRKFWETEYPDIADVRGCLQRIERAGYSSVSRFRVPKKDWFTHFYDPMKVRLDEVRAEYRSVPEALAMFETLESEVESYDKFSDYSGYEFFLMRKG